MEKNTVVDIPEAINKWISDVSKIYGEEYGVCIGDGFAEHYTGKDFERGHQQGAEAMYRHVSQEISALRKERGEYRMALEAVVKRYCDDLVSENQSMALMDIFNMVAKVLDQYPPSIVTDKTENNE